MIKLTDEELAVMSKVINRECGILYDSAKKYLFEARLQERLYDLRLSSFTEYLPLIDGPKSSKTEIEHFINAVTTNETSFFRNVAQIDALVNILLPEILRVKKTSGNNKVKIWSAASSSGEEIYTIAMILARKNAIPKGISLELYASDINTEVLAMAEAGNYSKHSLRNMPPEYRENFFENHTDWYKLKKEKLPKVRFDRINLLNPKYPQGYDNFDVVFCANILIYFGIETKRKVVDGISKIMGDNSYFFTGHSETLHNVSKNFKLVNANGIPVYQKL
ncbi:MAG: protein-glutamate O-methyltransferase CheR [Nitrospinota bacterium]|nr:protein-glutamate O-methyltransferase CheR [Nitrospinota bacterium]